MRRTETSPSGSSDMSSRILSAAFSVTMTIVLSVASSAHVAKPLSRVLGPRYFVTPVAQARPAAEAGFPAASWRACEGVESRRFGARIARRLATVSHLRPYRLCDPSLDGGDVV